MGNDEIANQDEIINKLNKEKKLLNENNAKATEDMQVVQEKADHLEEIKMKLENTMDELNDSLTREKRARADIEKQRRKKEGELKVYQETVAELERAKKEIEGIIIRKETDFSQLSTKLDEEQQVVAKAERQRSDLAREFESLGERLAEAGGATHAQIELNKKREAEVGKLRKDLEEAHIQQEATLLGLKKKHQDAVSEMSEQIDQLSVMKSKIEKDKTQIGKEIVEMRAAIDEVNRAKASAEKNNKNLLTTLNEVNRKVEEANLTAADFDFAKRKIAAENAELLRQLGEFENQANLLSKLKVGLQSQLDEAKRVADQEARERQNLLGRFKNLDRELSGMKEHYEEEVGLKDDILRQLSKAIQESDMWRLKYETEALAKGEDLEMAKMKLQTRLSDAQETIEHLNAKERQIPFQWIWMLHKKMQGMLHLSFSESNLPMKNLSSNWMKSERRIRA